MVVVDVSDLVDCRGTGRDKRARVRIVYTIVIRPAHRPGERGPRGRRNNNNIVYGFGRISFTSYGYGRGRVTAVLLIISAYAAIIIIIIIRIRACTP